MPGTFENFKMRIPEISFTFGSIRLDQWIPNKNRDRFLLAEYNKRLLNNVDHDCESYGTSPELVILRLNKTLLVLIHFIG